ncbi:hypothetical protein BCY86_05755 [Pajaroellobacter abortibovis]|uniref:Uncharacterized protein n=1 Tax=Pajaroellobacter abortibovis TaxID=1882918 RepID=A0A1L6MXN3_9BACT|nr:hypothetical protein BCY86_05755 [Pajaroellobacter abortibovis]
MNPCQQEQRTQQLIQEIKGNVRQSRTMTSVPQIHLRKEEYLQNTHFTLDQQDWYRRHLDNKKILLERRRAGATA